MFSVKCGTCKRLSVHKPNVKGLDFRIEAVTMYKRCDKCGHSIEESEKKWFCSLKCLLKYLKKFKNVTASNITEIRKTVML